MAGAYRVLDQAPTLSKAAAAALKLSWTELLQDAISLQPTSLVQVPTSKPALDPLATGADLLDGFLHRLVAHLVILPASRS